MIKLTPLKDEPVRKAYNMDFDRMDGMAWCGYKHAEGVLPTMPKFRDDIDVDAFNVGIRNYNSRHGTNVPPLFVRDRKIQDGANGVTADKELAIVGA